MASKHIIKAVPRIVTGVTTRETKVLAEKAPSLKSVSSVQLSFCPWQKESKSIK